MSDRAPRNMLIFCIGSVTAQAALACALVGAGLVSFEPVAIAQTPVALAGIVLGVLLYTILPSKQATLAHAPRSRAVIGLALLLVAFAVVEEIIWRGYIFTTIRAAASPLLAFVATTAGFAAMHTFAQGWHGVRTHAVTGTGIGLMFLFSGSLASAIAVHVAYNLMFVFDLRLRRAVRR